MKNVYTQYYVGAFLVGIMQVPSWVGLELWCKNFHPDMWWLVIMQPIEFVIALLLIKIIPTENNNER
jgi:hypothetical protein